MDDLAAMRGIVADLRRLRESYAEQTPQAVDIAVVERGRKGYDKYGVVVPNAVYINGSPVLASADHPVIVHEIDTSPSDAVMVTLTLFARRVVMSREEGGTDA